MARSSWIDASKIGLREGQSLKQVWPDGKVDLSLRNRQPRTELETEQKRVLAEVDDWCGRYERKIRELGGIGFFMGGIGPDGHVAFNCEGAHHFSTTRLDELNYPSLAAAAGDLGGMDKARGGKVGDCVRREVDSSRVMWVGGE